MKSHTVTEARPIIGRLVERAHRGKKVLIRRGEKLVQLMPVAIPARGKPAKFALSPEEVERINGAAESFSAGT